MGAVLVAGGAGYIGSHAAKALRAAGQQTVILDDLSAGHARAALGTPIVRADVADVAVVRETIRAHQVTAVMHFAAWLSVADSVTDPVGYYRNNVAGTLALLEAMMAESVRCFVFSSTAAVYGEPTTTPIDEFHPTRPINPYGETKLAIERALPHYGAAYGLRSVCLRYFNACGADPDGELGEDHEPEIHLIPLALAAASGGPPLRIFGDDYATPDGTCLRDYIHVSDLAAAHVLALGALREGRGDPCTVYNVGNGRPFSVREVMASVETVTGRPIAWSTAPRRAGDPAVLFASSERIRRELGWRPRVTGLDQIVDTAWRWHQRRSRAPATNA